MDVIKISHGINADGSWLTDKWAPHILWSIGLEETLFDKQSDFQRVQVVNTRGLGRMLILDGNLQAAEADEHGYHEMIVHPALCRAGAGDGAKRVLIIGGGDGGAAREALRHPDVERVDLCDIDGMVLDAARELLPTMWCNPDGASLDDEPRFVAHVRDGVKFLQETDERWDLIVVDASDPIGPGTVLYSPEFYAAIERCLTTTGAVTVQSGSWFYLPEVLQTVRKGLSAVFDRVDAYSCFTAIYPGGFWNLCMATRGDDPLDVNVERADALTGTRSYDAAAHQAAFALGPRAREVFAKDPPSLEEVSLRVEVLMG
jgi:spermidine synthase